MSRCERLNSRDRSTTFFYFLHPLILLSCLSYILFEERESGWAAPRPFSIPFTPRPCWPGCLSRSFSKSGSGQNPRDLGAGREFMGERGGREREKCEDGDDGDGSRGRKICWRRIKRERISRDKKWRRMKWVWIRFSLWTEIWRERGRLGEILKCESRFLYTFYSTCNTRLCLGKKREREEEKVPIQGCSVCFPFLRRNTIRNILSPSFSLPFWQRVLFPPPLLPSIYIYFSWKICSQKPSHTNSLLHFSFS